MMERETTVTHQLLDGGVPFGGQHTHTTHTYTRTHTLTVSSDTRDSRVYTEKKKKKKVVV